MLKINMLGGISYLPLFATDEAKAAAAKERERIEVTSNKKEEVKEEKQDEKEPENKEEKIEAKEDEIDDTKDEIEDLEKEKAEAKTDKEKERTQRRIDKLTAKNKALETELAAAKAALAAKPDDEKAYTEEEVERRAEEKANHKNAVKEFQASVKRIADSCNAIDKDFSTKVTAMVEEVTGPNTALPSIMVGILDDLKDHGGRVLMHLANNPDEYEDIYSLSPARMALKLKEIETDLIAKETKAKRKEISKVPEPQDTLKGKGTTPEQRASEKDDMATFAKKRAKEMEEYRRSKLGLH